MRVSVLGLVVLGVFVLTASSLADIPRVISYQGKVTDSGGDPVADGTYTMRFLLYNAILLHSRFRHLNTQFAEFSNDPR